jgi:hypothetical protein
MLYFTAFQLVTVGEVRQEGVGAMEKLQQDLLLKGHIRTPEVAEVLHPDTEACPLVKSWRHIFKIKTLYKQLVPWMNFLSIETIGF